MNIAEILQYCPKGTKLYSTIWGEVELNEVTNFGTIEIKAIDQVMCASFTLDYEGRYSHMGECVLFLSKDQRDWKKFRLPVKRGDIMMKADGTIPFIASGEFYKDTSPKYICGVDITGRFSTGIYGWTSEFYIPASEEAKKELFDKMAEAGYKWNADTLELEKIEPKFKEGDILAMKDDNTLFLFTGIIKDGIAQVCCLPTNGTSIDCGVSISSLKLVTITERNKFYSYLVKRGYKYDKEQHNLVKQEFKPFDKVLVRDRDTNPWKADIYLDYEGENKYCRYKCARMNYVFCIPYENNEYLLDTTNSPT